MIKPEGIPVSEIINVAETIEYNLAPLTKLGPQFTQVGAHINSEFRHLNDCYHAPEREQLVNSTQRIQDSLGEFGPKLPEVSRVLSGLAAELRAMAKELNALRNRAHHWQQEKNKNPDWQNDQWMIDENNDLIGSVSMILTGQAGGGSYSGIHRGAHPGLSGSSPAATNIPEAALNAANAIAALYGGRRWQANGQHEGDKPLPPPPLSDAERDQMIQRVLEGKKPPPPPWGAAEERDYPPLQDVANFVVGVGEGIYTGVTEALGGLLTIIPVLPLLGEIPGVRDFAKENFGLNMPTFKDTWDGLKAAGKLVLTVELAPVLVNSWLIDKVAGKDISPQWMRDLRETGVGAAKGFVAWDEWSKNPGKAFGTALTNVVTTVAGGGVIGEAKAASMAAKFGRAAPVVEKGISAVNYLRGTRVAIHDGVVGLAMKIPKVSSVVQGLSKIPIVGHTLRMEGVPHVDVPKTHGVDAGAARPEIDLPTGHTAVPETHVPSVEPVPRPPSELTTPTTPTPHPDSPVGPNPHPSHSEPVVGPVPSIPTTHTPPPTVPVGPAAPARNPQAAATPPSEAQHTGTERTATEWTEAERAGDGVRGGGSRSRISEVLDGRRPTIRQRLDGDPVRPVPRQSIPDRLDGKEPTLQERLEGVSQPADRPRHPDRDTSDSGRTGEPRHPDDPDETRPREVGERGAGRRSPEARGAEPTRRERDAEDVRDHGTREAEAARGDRDAGDVRDGQLGGGGRARGERDGGDGVRHHGPDRGESARHGREGGDGVRDRHARGDDRAGRSRHGDDETSRGRAKDAEEGNRVRGDRTREHGPVGRDGREARERQRSRKQQADGSRDRRHADEPGAQGHDRAEHSGTPREGRRTAEPAEMRRPDKPGDARRGGERRDESHAGESSEVRRRDDHGDGRPDGAAERAEGAQGGAHDGVPAGAQGGPHGDGHDAHDGTGHQGGKDLTGANDPANGWPSARQANIDKTTPYHRQPRPGVERHLVESGHSEHDRNLEGRDELREGVGGSTEAVARLRRLFRWVHKVNLFDGSKALMANCAEVTRRVCDIFNGAEANVAKGNLFGTGEIPEGTLEWMGLAEFPPENRFRRPPGHDGDIALDEQAYQLVRDRLKGRPPGTHANIGVMFTSGGGHRFAAVVDLDGEVKWIDAQMSGEARALKDGSDEQLEVILRDLVKPGESRPLTSSIQELEFAVREPGGRWEGPPRRPDQPTAAEMRHRFLEQNLEPSPPLDLDAPPPTAEEFVKKAAEYHAKQKQMPGSPTHGAAGETHQPQTGVPNLGNHAERWEHGPGEAPPPGGRVNLGHQDPRPLTREELARLPRPEATERMPHPGGRTPMHGGGDPDSTQPVSPAAVRRANEQAPPRPPHPGPAHLGRAPGQQHPPNLGPTGVQPHGYGDFGPIGVQPHGYGDFGPSGVEPPAPKEYSGVSQDASRPAQPAQPSDWHPREAWRSELADPRFRASRADEEAFRRYAGEPYTPEQLRELRDRGRRMLPDGEIDRLSDIDIQASETLLTRHVEDLNRAFHRGDRRVEQHPLVRNAISAMHKMSGYEGTVHRGVPIRDAQRRQAFIDAHELGGTVRYGGFTHSDQNLAGVHKYEVQVHIDSRHGRDMTYLRPARRGINEVIHLPQTDFYPVPVPKEWAPPGLPPGTTKFRDANGVWHLFVRDHSGPYRPSEAPPPPPPDYGPRGYGASAQFGPTGGWRGNS